MHLKGLPPYFQSWQKIADALCYVKLTARNFRYLQRSGKCSHLIQRIPSRWIIALDSSSKPVRVESGARLSNTLESIRGINIFQAAFMKPYNPVKYNILVSEGRRVWCGDNGEHAQPSPLSLWNTFVGSS